MALAPPRKVAWPRHGLITVEYTPDIHRGMPSGFVLEHGCYDRTALALPRLSVLFYVPAAWFAAQMLAATAVDAQMQTSLQVKVVGPPVHREI
jgi:hypothetical protein